RGGVDNPAVAGGTQMPPGREGDVERSSQVDPQHGLHQVQREVLKNLVAQDPGVVYDDLKAAKSIQRLLDQPLAPICRSHAVGVGDGHSAQSSNLLDHCLGGAAAFAVAADV